MSAGGEYALTDEQKAAVEAEQRIIGNASYSEAHRRLVMDFPQLFKNTGEDLAKVRMNWSPVKPVEEPPKE